MSVDYPGYFSCKEQDDGQLRVFHICTNREEANEWIDMKNIEPSESNEGLVIEDENSQTHRDSQSTEEGSYKLLLENFTNSMRSYYPLISISGNIAPVFVNNFIEREINKYRKDELVLIKKEGSVSLYGVPKERIPSLLSRIKRLDHLEEGMNALPSIVLMGLVASFDSHISGVVRFLLISKKERLSSVDKTIPVRDVLAMASFDELIQHLVDNEIYQLMRGSHEDQIKFIEENFSIKVREGFDKWAQFIEIFERRNLVAHGEGFANIRYDKICQKNKVKKEDRLELGEDVKLEGIYLRRSTDTLLEFGVLLIWWLWLKNSPEEREKAYSILNEVTYELIVDKRYRLASRLLKSGISRVDNKSPEDKRRMMAINLANCFKKLDNQEECEKAIELFDWSACADSYKISIASLRGDVLQVCELMPRVKEDNLVGKSGFRDWPVFDWVRDAQEFRDKFEELFNEPIEMPKDTGDLSSHQGMR